MKRRERGMPDESMWESFFDPPTVLAKLGLTDECRDVVDFGCGYGTFTIPAGRIAQGIVHAFDIEAEMVAATAARAKAAGLTNVQVWQQGLEARRSPGRSRHCDRERACRGDRHRRPYGRNRP